MELLGFIGGVATLQGYASNIKRLYILALPKAGVIKFFGVCIFVFVYVSVFDPGMYV